MPWSGWPTTPVSQLTFGEWALALRPGREVLAGYALRSMSAWHVLGDDRWVWFTAVMHTNRGAIEAVRQWSEAENLGPTHRHWRWVHWRNPSNETAYVRPRVLLAPPVDDRELRQVDQMSRQTRLWTLVDVATSHVAGFGFTRIAGDDTDEGGAGGRAGIAAAAIVRPLEGQRVLEMPLEGDERFLPLEELEARIDRFVARRGTSD